MGRRDIYRERRILRRKFILALFLCCAILTGGMCVADYSTNMLVYNKAAIGIAAVRGYEDFVEVSLLNKKIYINTRYINRDIARFKEFINSLMPFK